MAFALGGCAISPSCYVGISIFPPGPFVHCGVDAAPSRPAEDTTTGVPE